MSQVPTDDEVIRVLLVDDQPLFRSAVASVINRQPDLEVVGQAGNGLEALDLVRTLAPHVVLLDVEMPVMDGVETVRAITTAHPDVKVIMLTVDDDDDHLLGAIRGGAHGYLLKDLHPEQLFDRIRSVMRDEAPISASLVSRLLTHLRDVDDDRFGEDRPEDQLSPRELEILHWAATGMSNRQIGRTLFITEGTVKNHVHHALRKLGMENRVQATAYLIRRGLLTPVDN